MDRLLQILTAAVWLLSLGLCGSAQAQIGHGGFWRIIDVTPPPALTMFSEATPVAPGETHINFGPPADTSDWYTLAVRRLPGATAPNADCSSNGTAAVTWNGLTNTGPGLFSYRDTGLTAGSYYSYRACVYDGYGNLTSTNILTNIQARPACLGTLVGGYCWYKGAAYESCDTVCSSGLNRGGYNAATSTYAGAAGTTGNCSNVSNAFSDGGAGVATCNTSTIPYYGTNSNALGCCVSGTYGAGRCTGAATTSTATGSSLNVRRYCACNQ